MNAQLKAELMGSPAGKEPAPPLPILKYFDYKHLPAHLQSVSQPFYELAYIMDKLPNNAEKSAGLRKLLEAKDCAVRAALN